MTTDRKVYWAVGLPRMLHWFEADMLMMVARHTQPSYVRLRQPFPVRVNKFRAQIIRQFLKLSENPKDVLVLLDVDHAHPEQIVNWLASPEFDFPVFMALTFKRAMAFPVPVMLNYDQGWEQPPSHVVEYTPGEIVACDRGATAAFAVQRWVYQAMVNELIVPEDMFTYEGEEDCDKHFAKLCYELIGKQHVNTGIVSPHLLDLPQWVGPEQFDTWAKTQGYGGVVSAP